MNIQETRQMIDSLQAEVDALEIQIDNFELDVEDSEVIKAYEESLDCGGTVTVCGMEFEPSRILKELDPVAYRCGLSDHTSNMDLNDNEDYKALVSEKEDKESEIETLKDELEENAAGGAKDEDEQTDT